MEKRCQAPSMAACRPVASRPTAVAWASAAVCAAEVYAVSDSGEESLCATLLGTARNIDTTRYA
jgi:hypothetical protein